MLQPRPTRRRARLLAGLAALALATVAVIFALPQPQLRAPRPVSETGAAQPSPATARAPAAVATAPSGPTPRALLPVERREPRPAQGLLGRVVDDAGAPLADVTVELQESAGSDPLRLGWTPRQRSLLAPMAATQTDAAGGFELGLPFADEHSYDVFVRSARHATLRLTGLRVLPSVWHDLGDLSLEPGATIRGRVTVHGSPRVPVPAAVVQVAVGGTFADGGAAAAAGARGALQAQVDGDGFYELEHAPTRGVVQVSATAAGFARAIRRDVGLQPDSPAVVDFAMRPGRALVGAVRDEDGDAVPDALVSVWPRDAGAHPLQGRSGADGSFRVPGLDPAAPHRVVVTATGYARGLYEDVGPLDPLACTLRRRAHLRVKVSTPAGAVLRDYRLALRRYFPTATIGRTEAEPDGHIGAARDVQEQRVRLDNATDTAAVLGVPDGTYVVEVRAAGWAKSFSSPFTVAAPDAAADGRAVEVIVTAGATLRGRVLDAEGRPLAGATVTTQPPGTLPDHPMLVALQRAVPPRVTLRTVESDERGWFRLERLAAAVYQLQVDHPDGCRQVVQGIDCKSFPEITLQDIRLPSGATIRGRATLAGQPAGQIKVILTTSGAVPADQSLRVETVTDKEGRYAFARRIPPGEYVLRAAVVGGAQPNSELFRQMLQLQDSTTPPTVAAGQSVIEQRLDLRPS